jgi:hypothetical protein
MQLLVGVGARGLFEESQEFLVAVAVLADAGDLAGGDLQRGEQGGGAVADVVVGVPLRRSTGEIPCSSVGSIHGHQRGDLLTASGEKYMTVDTAFGRQAEPIFDTKETGVIGSCLAYQLSRSNG